MLLLQFEQAAVVAVDLPQRADATPAFVVYNGSGGTALSSTSVTMDAVDTTLNGALSAGATTAVLTSVSGVTAGRRYLMGGSEDAGGEFVTVKSLSGSTATLVRPLRYAHATASAFQSTRVTCAVTADTVATIGRHYRLEVTWAVSTVTQPAWVLSFDVTRYAARSTVTSLEDVAAGDPLLGKRLPAGLWWPDLRDAAWDEITDRVAAKVDPGALVSGTALSRAHRYLCRVLIAETGGPDWSDYRDRMAQRVNEIFDGSLAATAVDDDQDGASEAHEGVSPHTITILRG